jgi:hypothetical protein
MDIPGFIPYCGGKDGRIIKSVSTAFTKRRAQPAKQKTQKK